MIPESSGTGVHYSWKSLPCLGSDFLEREVHNASIVRSASNELTSAFHEVSLFFFDLLFRSVKGTDSLRSQK